MLLFLQRHVLATWLFLIALFGITLGCLTATILGLNLGEPLPKTSSTAELAPPANPKTAADYASIPRRNIFDSTAPALSTGTLPKTSEESPVVTVPRVDLKLIGTITGGEENSLALIEAEKKLQAYRLNDKVPGGGRLVEIARNVIHIEYADGSISMLLLYQDNPPPRRTPPPAQAAGGNGIRSVEQNRWLIDTSTIEEARANLGEVLKSARMEPRLVNGATDGFTIAMIRPGSLLSRMGLRKGDVVLQVNGMPLNSPEKALQVFQQLREARSLSVSLERRGKPELFEYEVN